MTRLKTEKSPYLHAHRIEFRPDTVDPMMPELSRTMTDWDGKDV